MTINGRTGLRSAAAAPELPLEQLDRYRWRIPCDPDRGMLVDGLVIADASMIETLRQHPALGQLANAAALPGIVGAAVGLPNIHWGDGFPVGGVVATRQSDGVISPGGVGHDIGCGMRLLRTDLTLADVRSRLATLVEGLRRAVPSGLEPHSGKRLSEREMEDLLAAGARWVMAKGLGWDGDLEMTEDGGGMAGADPACVSRRARQRGADQLGTLGSGEHFVEVDVVDRIHEGAVADAFGLHAGQVVVLIHSGSRGLGHQVCVDAVAAMDRSMSRNDIQMPERQLACARIASDEGRAYLGAMAAAGSFALANRQAITNQVRDAFGSVFGEPAERLGLQLVHDVSHNLARFERHRVGGLEQELCVHRRGAARSLAPGDPDLPERYASVGQPLFVAGDMGRCSYVGVSTQGADPATAASDAFRSSPHGAGRRLSRNAAVRAGHAPGSGRNGEPSGVLVQAYRPDLLPEAASHAYRDVEDVVAVAEGAGLMRRVARISPLAVVRG